MERFEYVEPEEADPFTRKLFKRVGMVPNLYSMMANSPMVFDGFLKLNACLEGAKLEKKIREMVYLCTSQHNGCTYCVSSHTATGTEHGVMTLEETFDARRGRSADPRVDAMLRFATEVLERHGDVTDEALEAVRGQGFGDDEILEAVGTIAMATLSNYTCRLARPDLDYKEAPPLPEER